MTPRCRDDPRKINAYGMCDVGVYESDHVFGSGLEWVAGRPAPSAVRAAVEHPGSWRAPFRAERNATEGLPT
jgi:hypothetical protein